MIIILAPNSDFLKAVSNKGGLVAEDITSNGLQISGAAVARTARNPDVVVDFDPQDVETDVFNTPDIKMRFAQAVRTLPKISIEQALSWATSPDIDSKQELESLKGEESPERTTDLFKDYGDSDGDGEDVDRDNSRTPPGFVVEEES
jgi:hypothetical protein